MTIKTTLLTASALGATLTGAAVAQEITVWDWKSGDPAAYGYIDEATRLFEEAHPGVEVNFVMQPNDQYYTLLGTALSSNAGPDVFLLNGGAQAQARFDALADVSDMAEGLLGTEEFSDADGTVYALPITTQGFVVYANKQRYADAGLDPEALPTTWDELSAACEAIIAQGDVPCFSMGNKEGFAAEFFVSALAASMLTAEEHAALKSGELAWSSPKMTAILDAWVETEAAGWYPQGGNSTAKFMDEYETFMRGEAANTIGLLSDVAHWKQFDDFLGAENLGVFRHPAPDASATAGDGGPMMPVAGGIGYGVNRASENIDLARELVATLASAEAIAIFAQDAGILPANPEVDTSAANSPTLTAILGMMDGASAPMAHANVSAGELEDLHRQSQLLLNGENTVQDAVQRLDAAQAAAE
ncbi:extracellular solute-binding protein [Salipiger sp. IMCC34102]|uniref:ABC transporter substrate-binding protein n=1 Tax=Salipiger sp. IMCC34102 TaxID=2510647 RepID=UPI00101E18C6|nr:extracellular solute-binding protein [Salipiger sp. IMCC34102]RYH04272.1 extracellular solute-binding protein [Salipiger sp. IMCC34102]